MNREQWSTRRARLTRRRLLRGAGALAAGGSIWLAAACRDGGDTGTANGTGAARSAQATPEQPRTGGTLTAGQVTDIALATGFPYTQLPQNRFLMFGTMEPLVRYDKTLEPTLVLLDQYNLSDDQSSATLRLKPGLTFHNGTPVTPEDVFFALDVMVAPQQHNVTGSIQLSTFARMITERTRLDERTMRFRFDKPRPNITDFFAQLMITPAATYPELQNGRNVQGTGPFKLVSWSPTQAHRMERNPNWHQAGTLGGPYLDAVEVQNFADVQALGLAIESGQVDLALEMPGSVARPFRDRNQTRIAPKVGVLYMGCNVTNPLLRDARVRRAIFLAIDRERIVNEAGEGFGNVTVQSWPETSPAFDPALERAFYQPNEARQLLTAAGFPADRPLTIEFSSGGGSQAIAEIVQQNLRAIGMNIQLAPQEGNVLTAKLTQRQFTDMWITTHAFADMSPLTNFQQTFPFRIPNPSYYESPEYLDIIRTLEGLDPLSEQAKAQYQRFNNLWLNDPWMIPLQPRIRVDILGRNLRGLDDYYITIYQSFEMGTLWKAR